MVSKQGLRILGLLVIVVLISTEVAARNLVEEVVKEQNDAGDVKYDENQGGRERCTNGVGPNCFGIPGMPGIPGFPGIPGIPGIPGMPGAPPASNSKS